MSDPIRRSKRNKFHLDVAAMLNPERRRSQPGGHSTPPPSLPSSSSSSSSSDPSTSLQLSASPPLPIVEDTPPPLANPPIAADPPQEEGRRRRKRTSINPSYYYPDEIEEEHPLRGGGLTSPNTCSKCPARFDTKPGLANHLKLHGCELERKFTCNRCDFGCDTSKSMSIHSQIHDRFEVEIHSDEKKKKESINDTIKTQLTSPPPILSPIARRSRNGRMDEHNTPPTLTPPPMTILSNTPSTSKSRPKRKKCPDCPFITRTNARINEHMNGHTRTIGFQCPACTFKSGSAGFLKRHVEVHQLTSYVWPPKYVNLATDLVNEAEKKRRISTQPRMKPVHAKCSIFMRLPVRGCLRCSNKNCSYKTKKVPLMIFHKRRNHPKTMRIDRIRQPFVCRLCDCRLQSRGAYKAHMCIRHSKKRNTTAAKKFFLDERLSIDILLDFERELRRLKSGSTAEQPETKVKDEEEMIELKQEPERSKKNDKKSDEFRCADCHFVTPVKDRLERHQSKHLLKGENQCPHCTFSCRSLPYLQLHIAGHIPEKKTTPNTPILSTASTSSTKDIPLGLKWGKSLKLSNMEADLRYTDEHGIRWRKCPECPYTTKHSCDLRTHYDMHLTPGQYKCSQCSYRTKRTVTLRSHYLLHYKECISVPDYDSNKRIIRLHGKEVGWIHQVRNARLYVCKQCPFATKLVSDLWKHHRRHCIMAPSGYRCSDCSFSSIFLAQMEAHQAVHHEKCVNIVELGEDANDLPQLTREEQIYHCSDCTFTSTSYQRWWTHQQRHKRNNKFQCSECSFGAGTEQCLEEHMTSIHGSSNRLSSLPPSLASSSSDLIRIDSSSSINNRLIQSKRRRLPISSSPTQISQKSPIASSDTSSSPSSGPTIKTENTSLDELSRDSLSSGIHIRTSITLPKELIDKAEDCKKYIKPTSAVLAFLNREKDSRETLQCHDCPYMETDETLFHLHRQLHIGRTRSHACQQCTYSCFSAESLHSHLDLHLQQNIQKIGSTIISNIKTSFRRQIQETETLLAGRHYFSCTQCTYKTVQYNSFIEHRMEHARQQQQKLVTQIKRNAEEDICKKPAKRVAKKADYNFMCTMCAFRCEYEPLYSRHKEFHQMSALHQCRICNYSCNTKTVVDYHEQMHHNNTTLTQLNKSAVLAPDVVKLSLPSTIEERVRLSGSDYQCQRCNYKSLDIHNMANHYRLNHHDSEEDKQVARFLSMGMLPSNNVSTLVG